HGVKKAQFKISDNNLSFIISNYTRESGVRALNKQIAKLIRHRAKDIGFNEKYKSEITKSEIETILGVPPFIFDMYEGNDIKGVVTGLAWTEVGGEILFIESSYNKGKGGLTLTGNLGDVMKESATIALQWVKANADELGIDATLLETNDVHIHVPEGATPKDG
ncbi:MAG: S16 family serine protease, partial [Rikenellaceae bacterium]